MARLTKLRRPGYGEKMGAGWRFAWLVLYATVVAKAGDVLRRPRIRRSIEAVTGTVLVALGVRLATEPR